jgi:hypothetical protein
VLFVRATTPQTVKGGDKPKYQTSVQKQVEKELMLDVVVCLTEGSDEESGQTACREENSQFRPSPGGRGGTLAQDEHYTTGRNHDQHAQKKQGDSR